MHESDEEETLSLCDLPLYSNSSTDQSSEWEHVSALDSGSISSQDDDYFEFSSQEFTPSAAADFPPENIIFCGKLIPYKQPHNNNNNNQPMIQKANNSSNSPDLLIIESKQNRIEMWKNSSTSNGARGTTLMQSPPTKKTYNTKSNKQLNLSLFTSSSSSGKTKWYFLFFGSPRFSTEVDLRDFKSRRRSLRRQFSSPPPMFGFENREDYDDDDDGDGDFVSGGRNRRWGLWGMLIKVLSCGGGNHQSAAAAASIGCSTPRATET
ncbi:hypothetical protein ACP275_06G174900 [Erythranthe tilingii]